MRGESIGIISGSNIIALRKVEVEPVDDYAYAMREYGVTRKELDKFGAEVERHSERRKGRVMRVTSEQLRKGIDQVSDHQRRGPTKAR